MEYKLPPLPTMSDLGDSGASNYGYSADDMQAYAIAAIEAQGVPDGWQPIETAQESMDECVVVGWLDDEGLPRTEFDYKEDGCWIKWHEHAEHTEVIGGHGVSHTPPYTRWLKLPPLASAPPAPQAKPIGWLYDWTHSSALGKPDEHFTSFTTDEEHARKNSNARPVFGAAQQAKPQPLSDEQMWKLWNAQGSDDMNQQEAIAFARAIESAHGIKGS